VAILEIQKQSTKQVSWLNMAKNIRDLISMGVTRAKKRQAKEKDP